MKNYEAHRSRSCSQGAGVGTPFAESPLIRYSPVDCGRILLIARVSHGMGAQRVDGSYSAGLRRDDCRAEASAVVALIRLEFSSRGCLRRLPAARFAPARCGFVFVLRNSARAKRRGWITSSSAGADVNVGADLPPRRIIISWRNPDGTIYGVDKDDDSLDDGTPSGSKLIEHEANPKPPDKD